MSDKVGTRSFRAEEQDAGSGFVRVNDVSPSMQETIDLEIQRLMQVTISMTNFPFPPSFSLIGII
jgi:hypothetical protein